MSLGRIVLRGVRTALGLSLLGSATAASANHVDFMVDGAFGTISANSLSGPVSDTQIGAGGNILDTEREVTLAFTTGSGFVAAATTSGVAAGPGPVGRNPNIGISFSNDAGSIGTLDILIDGVGSTGMNGGLGRDFDTQWNFLQVFFPVIDPGVDGTAGDAILTVTDASSNTASVSQTVLASGAYFYPFADFTGVDFFAVTSVNLRIDTTGAGADFLIGEITREVVPEPGTALLMGLGLGGLALLRRR